MNLLIVLFIFSGNPTTSTTSLTCLRAEGTPRSDTGPGPHPAVHSTPSRMLDEEEMEIADDDPSSEALETGNSASKDEVTLNGGDTAQHGKRFQRESTFLKLLPYYESLKEETEGILDKTIRNLAKAVLCQDFQVGGVLYTKALWT